MAITKTAAALQGRWGGAIGGSIGRAIKSTLFKTVPVLSRGAYRGAKATGRGALSAGKGLWRANVAVGRLIGEHPLLRNMVLPSLGMAGVLGFELPGKIRANMHHVDPQTDITTSQWSGINFKSPEWHQASKEMDMLY